MDIPCENIACKTLWSKIPWTRLRDLEIGCAEITPILNQLINLKDLLRQENIDKPIVQLYIKQLQKKQLVCPLREETVMVLQIDETKVPVSDVLPTPISLKKETPSLTGDVSVELSKQFESVVHIDEPMEKKNRSTTAQVIPNKINITQVSNILSEQFDLDYENIIHRHIHVSLPLIVISDNTTLEIMNINIDTGRILPKSKIDIPMPFIEIRFHNILPLILCDNGQGDIFIYYYNIPTRIKGIVKSGLSSILANKLNMEVRHTARLNPSISTRDSVVYATTHDPLTGRVRFVSNIEESKYIREKIDLSFKINYKTNSNSKISSFHPTLPIFITFNEISNSITVCRLIDEYSKIVELFVLPVQTSDYYIAFHPSLPFLMIAQNNLIQIFQIEQNFSNAKLYYHFKHIENSITAIKFHHMLPIFIVGYSDSIWTLWSLDSKLQLITWAQNNDKFGDKILDFYFHDTLPIFAIIRSKHMELWQNRILSMSEPYHYFSSNGYIIYKGYIMKGKKQFKADFYFHNNLFTCFTTKYINQEIWKGQTKYSGKSQLDLELYVLDPSPKIFSTRDELYNEIYARSNLKEWDYKEDQMRSRWNWYNYDETIDIICKEQKINITDNKSLSEIEKNQKLETLQQWCENYKQNHQRSFDSWYS